MTTPHLMRRLAAVSLLTLSLATFAPVGLNLASAAGDTAAKNTAPPGEAHNNDDHTKAPPAQAQAAPKPADKPAAPARPADAAKPADAPKDVDSPGCAFGNDQKNGQLATAPGCTKDDGAKPADADTAKPADADAAKPADAAKDVDSPGCAFGNDQKNGQLATAPGCNKEQDAKANPDQPLVATASQPIIVTLDTPVTTPAGVIIPAGTVITILAGTLPISGQVEGATISAPGVPAFDAPVFTAEVAGVTIQQSPDSLVASAEIPGSLPQTGGGYGQL